MALALALGCCKKMQDVVDVVVVADWMISAGPMKPGFLSKPSWAYVFEGLKKLVW